ncbi:CubicO group peptidase (beta-lactamase class C family) [Microbacterium resistens]|uniref:CubicO group peptidase (Beta-lactamase class C family) n=1 Tax=Microbacterium resistens TaxID=156977 RepID=A0ABU1SFD9_9MICO|nr:serine hydrolase domain-containing protein [Microbacterium resistens]MDR6868326.1 CubicO group peptidase (beta-lactamase class C family) [Microbacterium resistens]
MTVDIDALGGRLRTELLDDRIKEGEPGAVIGVYHDGQLVASACRGLADLETGEALTPRSLLNLASVSKQIVATAILIAARQGAVDLDADVRVLVPELQLTGVTLRRCLQHTAGLPDYLTAAGIGGVDILDIAALDAFVSWISTVTAHDFEPGQDESYSNTGFVLAALATERATGVPFPELVRRTVLVPLGMTRSRVTTLLGETAPGLAISFTPEAGGFTRHGMGIGEVDPVRGVNGDGEVLTSVEEFGAWHGFLADGRVLGADIRAQLLTRAVLADGRVSSYGLGIEHERRGDTTAHAHSGSMWGYRAYSLNDPVTGIGIAVFANRDDLDAVETAWRAFRLATGFAEISGAWFSVAHAFGLRLRVHANGDLEVGDGSAVVRLVRDGEDRWTNDDDLSLVEVVDGRLRAAVWFGVTREFVRLRTPTAHPAGVIGRFREPHHGGAYRFEDRDGALVAIMPDGEEIPVTPFGEREGEWIGSIGGDWLLVGTTPGGPVRYGAGTLMIDLHPSEA